jgi:IS5 family transposase
LIQIASTTLDQAAQAAVPLQEQKSDRVGTRLLAQLIQLQPLIKKVIEQARRRVLQGETVPAQEKVASLWELHTQIIRRGKPPPHETEFGHKVDSAEVEHGLISDWQVIARGNPPDAERLPPLLKQHCLRFGHAPHVLAGDRSLFSADNESLARSLGVEHTVLPQTGRPTPERTAYENQD